MIYDKKYAKPDCFGIGDKVLKKDFLKKKRAGGKLDTSYIGPYEIIKIVGKGLYSLRKVSNPNSVLDRVTGTHLKLYKIPLCDDEPEGSVS